uniref:Uncharacterized protein n=1 Tax=Arundo donax TaxID=35708 RepID=A0A0A9C9P5_ARUDO
MVRWWRHELWCCCR